MKTAAATATTTVIPSITMPSEISVVQLAGCREPRVDLSSLLAVSQHDRCVIHPNECPYEFVNPLDMDIMIDHPSCNNVASTLIGHCGSISTGKKRDCALTRDACQEPDSFVRPALSLNPDQHALPDGSSCTVLQDMNNFGSNLSNNDGLTRYIGCSGGNIDSDDFLDTRKGKGHICVTTIPECRELAGSDESVTITLSDPKCDCSQTKTGACFRTGDVIGVGQFNYFCAATEEVCDTDLGLSYQDVDQLMRYTDIDCRLCDVNAVNEYKLAVTTVPRSFVGVIVGISVLGSTLLLVLFRYFYFLIRKGTTEGKKSSTINEAPESSNVVFSSNLSKTHEVSSDDDSTLALQEDGKSFKQVEEEYEEIDESDAKVLQATYT